MSAAIDGHPQGLRTLFFTELWERFSFYGMRALLTLFMVAPIAAGGLGFDIGTAALVYGNYSMAVYVLAIPGGYVADTMIGTRRAILIGGTMIAAGHFALAVPATVSFYAGLTLIALGTGLFKPSISAMVGGLYAPGDPRRDAGFAIFYMGINIGAFFSPLVTGFLAQSPLMKGWLTGLGLDPTHSWHWGFAAAGVGMTVALATFAAKYAGQSEGNVEPAPAAAHGAGASPALRQRRILLAILVATAAIMGAVVLSDHEGFEWIRYGFVAVPALLAIWFGLSDRIEWRRLGAVCVLFIASMIFWALFEQAGVTLSLFADQLTRAEFADLSFPSSWFQSLNPLFVIALSPLFAVLWLRLGTRQPSSPTKFAAALALLAASFLLMVPAAKLSAEGRVSPLWLVGLYFLQTLGELLLSPVGLSTMTKLAPARAVALVLGVWFLAAALGNKLAGVLGSAFTATDAGGLASYFFWQGAVVAGAALVLLLLTPWVRRLMAGVT